MTPFPPYRFNRPLIDSTVSSVCKKSNQKKLEIEIFDILEPTQPTWMGRVNFWVWSFLGHLMASWTTIYRNFLLIPNDAKLTFKAIITMRGHVERVDVPVTRETTMLEANTIVRTENRKCIFDKKNLSIYLKSKDFTHKMKRVWIKILNCAHCAPSDYWMTGWHWQFIAIESVNWCWKKQDFNSGERLSRWNWQ